MCVENLLQLCNCRCKSNKRDKKIFKANGKLTEAGKRYLLNLKEILEEIDSIGVFNYDISETILNEIDTIIENGG